MLVHLQSDYSNVNDIMASVYWMRGSAYVVKKIMLHEFPNVPII